jgi:hypothetical protein
MSNAELAARCGRILFELYFIYLFNGLFKRMLGEKQGKAGGARLNYSPFEGLLGF